MNYLLRLFLAGVGSVLSVPTVNAIPVNVDAVDVTDTEAPPPTTSMLPRTLKWSKKSTPSSASPPPPASSSPPPLDPQLLYVAQNQHCSLYRSGSEEMGTYWFVTEYQEKMQQDAAAAAAAEDIIVFANRPFRSVNTMSIEKFVEEFPQKFQTSNPNVAVTFFPNAVCDAEDDKEESGNGKPALVAIFSDPQIITLDYKDGTTKMFVGYTVTQSPSQADEASLASYFGDATEEDKNGIVSTPLGPCSMMIDSVLECGPGEFPFLCGTTHHCLPTIDKGFLNSTNCAGILESIKEFENDDVPPTPPPSPVACANGARCCTFGCAINVLNSDGY